MDETKRLLADGGMLDHSGEKVNGVEVPTGSLKEEVADDVPTYLSEGEFVFPADVVRYLGLQTLMALRDKAKKGLARMEEIGQVGNAREVDNPDQTFGGEEEEDTSQFESDIDEIVKEVDSGEGEPVKAFAEGGVVFSANTEKPMGSAINNTNLEDAPSNPTVDVRYFKHSDGRIIFVTHFNGKPSLIVPDGFTQIPKEQAIKLNAAKKGEVDTATTSKIVNDTLAVSGSSYKPEDSSSNKNALGTASNFEIDPETGEAKVVEMPKWLRAALSIIPGGSFILVADKLRRMSAEEGVKEWNKALKNGSVIKDTVQGKDTFVKIQKDASGLYTGMGTTVVKDETGSLRLVTVSTDKTIAKQDEDLLRSIAADEGLKGAELDAKVKAEMGVLESRSSSTNSGPLAPDTGGSWGAEGRNRAGDTTPTQAEIAASGVLNTTAGSSSNKYEGVGSTPMSGAGDGTETSSSWNTSALTSPVAAPSPTSPAPTRPAPTPEPYRSSSSSGNYGSSSGVATGGGTTVGGNTTSEGGGDRGTRGGWAKGGLINKRKPSTPSPKPKKGLAARK